MFPLRLIVGAITVMIAAAPVMADDSRSEATASRRVDGALQEALLSHVEVLADDALEGREAGRAGGRAAATYIMRALRDMRIEPAGTKGTYFQPFGSGYRNVLAIVRGQHPALTSESVIISAHYDHVGYGSAANSNGPIGRIHNGADDNASGVAVLIELARELQSRQDQLARSVLIVFWDAEEKGLWGSKYWLEHPTLNLPSVRLMINIDMIGRLQGKLSLLGTRSMPGLRFAWSSANTSSHLPLDFPWRVYNNSDHFLFFRRQIPVTMVHTGLHDDYHRPSDDVERLNVEGMVRVSQLVLPFVLSAANQAELSPFRKDSWREGSRHQRQYEGPIASRPPRLGVTLSEQPGGWLSIEKVTIGSAADRAGLRPGQMIQSIDGKSTGSISEFRRHLQRRETVTLRVGPTDQVRDLDVALDGNPPRIGISWRTTPAEPNCVMISHVSEGSPAQHAGLRRLDRIHRIDGKPFGDSHDFKERISQTSGMVQLQIERSGQLQSMTLEVPPL